MAREDEGQPVAVGRQGRGVDRLPLEHVLMVEGPLLRCGGQDASEEQDEGGQGDKAGACARVSHLFISGRRPLATGPRQTSVDGVDSSRSGRDPARGGYDSRIDAQDRDAAHPHRNRHGRRGRGTSLRRCRPADAGGVARRHCGEPRSLRPGRRGRFVSGVTLIAVAWCLFRIPSHRGRGRSAVVPLLFAVSGALTAYSGVIAVGLAAMPPEWRIPPASRRLRSVTRKRQSGCASSPARSALRCRDGHAHDHRHPIRVWLAVGGGMLLKGRTWIRADDSSVNPCRISRIEGGSESGRGAFPVSAVCER